MPTILNGVSLTLYVLPAEGTAARAALLRLLTTAREAWIAAYALTDHGVVSELLALDAAGVPVHLLLDQSQAGGAAEHVQLLRLHGHLAHGDLTITTAGPDSVRTTEIMHSKVVLVRPADGPMACWTGSVNFSTSGWFQANVVTIFASDIWAQAFIAWFEQTRDWARQHVPQTIAAPAADALQVGYLGDAAGEVPENAPN